jgi:glycosyltransferase involved in cell wall biosynthesis
MDSSSAPRCVLHSSRVAIAAPATQSPTGVDSARGAYELTVIVPTRNEAGNIEELVTRCAAALRGVRAELLFVDDSTDRTPEQIERVAERAGLDVRVRHRLPRERTGGLGGAVVDGMRRARAPWVVVMDGDLQHPPEVLPRMLAAATAPGVDLVAATRYAGSGAGAAAGLGTPLRRWVSRMCTLLVKILFPRRMRGISDPMGGFFAVRLAALDVAALRPPGYKILFEILARSSFAATAEVPYTFASRASGQSKASLRQGMRFLRQVATLRMLGISPVGARVGGFMAVGASGVVINTAVLWVLAEHWRIAPYLIASAAATQIAMAWNFALVEILVFRGRRVRSLSSAFLRFWLVNSALLPVQLLLLAVAVDGIGVQAVPANLAVLAAVFGARYLLSELWVYGGEVRDKAPAAHARQAHSATELAVFAGRVLLPLVATVAVFPPAAREFAEAFATFRGATLAGAVSVAAAVIIAVRCWPRHGEPDVHDREVDGILMIPFAALGLWLEYGWAPVLGPRGTLLDRDIIAVVALLAGSSIALCGTRMAARLRWAIAAPLAGLPALAARPPLQIAAVVLIIAMAAASVHHARSDRRVAPWPRPVDVHLPRLGAGALAVAIAAVAVTAVAA